jgi:hypothetical protein
MPREKKTQGQTISKQLLFNFFFKKFINTPDPRAGPTGALFAEKGG